MKTPLKWIFVSVIFLVLSLTIAYASSIQNIATRTTAGIETLSKTINTGEVRNRLHKGISDDYFDKKVLIANLLRELMIVQKDHPYDIKLDYVFYDKDGEVTEDDKKIKSVQFRVQYIDSKGRVKGTAERRLAVNELSGGG